MNSHPQVRAWKQSTGTAFRRGSAISFGLKGSADISGIVGPAGTRLEVECKTGLARQTPGQEKFQEMIEKLGGVYIVARNVEDACDQLQKIFRLRGLSLQV